MRRLTFLLVLAAQLLGCAPRAEVTKTLVATGGSRSDGVVEMSFEYEGPERYRIDWDAALASARQRCLDWGYSDAKPFGGTKSSCQMYAGGDCERFFATVAYQCLRPSDPAR